MDDQRMRKCVAWYDEVYEDHRRLVETVVGILTTAAGAHALEYLSIAGRVKTRQSFLNKVRSKGYRQPELQVTDLSGVRVITYVESAAEKAASLVRQTLDVVDEHSLDKSRALGADRVGYRSLHFVCRLGGQRTQLAEYAAFGDLVFEIQVRTVLQHAWAEIEHDRNYKLAGSLPPPLERRINLLAGLLEIADREFNAISEEADRYAHDVATSTRDGDLVFDLNALSVRTYIREKLSDVKGKLGRLRVIDSETGNIDDVVVEELRRFGVRNLGELDELFEHNVDVLRGDRREDSTPLGVLHNLMMNEDLQRFLDDAWDREDWNGMDAASCRRLERKYGSDLYAILHAARMDVFSDDWDD